MEEQQLLSDVSEPLGSQYTKQPVKVASGDMLLYTHKQNTNIFFKNSTFEFETSLVLFWGFLRAVLLLDYPFHRLLI